jgi:Sensors of blue-light using FAD
MDLIHCIYSSASVTADFKPADLAALLEVCRRDNAAADISGMLLYRDGTFFQVLEGDRPVVDALFDKIALDKRHCRTAKIISEAIPERDFAAWTMGYPKISPKEQASVPGLNDFFTRGKSFLDLGEGRTRTLLAAFKSGKWRSSLS